MTARAAAGGRRAMTHRALRRLPWVAWTLAAALFAGSIALSVPIPEASDAGGHTWIVVQLAFTTVGALIAVRQPDNRVGWLLQAVGLVAMVQAFAYRYALFAATVTETHLPGEEWAAWVAAWTSVPMVVGLLVYLPLLFPDGRLPARNWRWLAWPAAGLLVAGTLALAFRPGQVEDLPVSNPLGIDAAAGMLDAFYIYGLPLLGVPGLAAAVSLVLRFRHARGPQRQQLKWFAFAVVVVAGWVFAISLLEVFRVPPNPAADLAGVVALLGLPAAVAVAVLRYRLYEIDRVINRTLVYGLLTAGLALVYFTGVFALQALLRPVAGESQLAVAGSTLAVAAAFGPLRQRIQATVDRRFNRARYDAQLTVAAFSMRLRDEIDLDQLTGELLGVVCSTVEPEHAWMWLRSDHARVRS